MLTRMDRMGSGRALARACLVGAAMLAGAAPARAQDTNPDPRWQAWLGCWEQAGAPATGGDASRAALMCVLPVAGTPSAVELATVVDREIVSRTRIDASGERRALKDDDCTGWESARWSADGRRLFLRSETTCPGGVKRASNGIFALTARGEWLDVQGVEVAGNQGVRVARHREVRSTATLPTEKAAQVRDGERIAVSTARLAAATPVTTAEVIEASHDLDAPVVEAWLMELGHGFGMDARQLLALDEARVPSSVIDLMVALSYPEVFAIESGTSVGDLQAPAGVERRGLAMPASTPASPELSGWDRFGYGAYGSLLGLRYGYSPFGYSPYGLGYGYDYGYGWYSGYRPVVVVVRPSPDEQPRIPAPRPRVVNGRGYTQDDRWPSSAGDRSPNPARNPDMRPTSTPSTGSSTTSSSGSSSGSSERTAKPRPQGGSN